MSDTSLPPNYVASTDKPVPIFLVSTYKEEFSTLEEKEILKKELIGESPSLLSGF